MNVCTIWWFCSDVEQVSFGPLAKLCIKSLVEFLVKSLVTFIVKSLMRSVVESLVESRSPARVW